MERFTQKKVFDFYNKYNETTTILIDDYIEIIESEKEIGCRIDVQHNYLVGDAVERLAEYEDLEEKIAKKFAGCISMKTILDAFCDFYDMQEVNEELAQCTLLTNEEALKYRQWKEAEEQGLLLRLPYKAGDTIWIVFSDGKESEIKSFKVSKITIGKNHDYITMTDRSRFTIWGKKWDEYFNRFVYTTKEEAEEALARMERT